MKDIGFGVALTRPLSCMLYCCGGKDAEEALGTAGSDVLRGRDEVPLSGYDMCGVAEMPELIPPTPSFHPSQTPTEYRPGSTHRRPPKLGQIGRSKRVVIEDEDLDDIMNNNAPLPLQISHSPA